MYCLDSNRKVPTLGYVNVLHTPHCLIPKYNCLYNRITTGNLNNSLEKSYMTLRMGMIIILKNLGMTVR